MSRQVDLKSLVSHIVRGDGLDKCRICMGDTSEGQVHLTDTVMVDGDKAVTLSELLEVVTGVELVVEALCPSGVCVSCCRSALAAQEFRTSALASQARWRAILHQLHALPSHAAHDPRAKSLCAILTDGPMTVYKDYDQSKALKRRTKPDRKRTTRSGPTINCPDCGKQFTSPHQLVIHLQNSEDKDACVTCGAVVTRGVGLKEHLAAVHGVNGVMCARCPSVHATGIQLREHEKVAHAAGSLSCGACSRVFRRARARDSHVLMHAVLSCRLCGAQFTNRSCYRVHRAGCEPRAKPLSSLIPRSRRSNNRDPGHYECDDCGKRYCTRPQLQNHILWIHLGHRPHQCSVCGKRFHTVARLSEHSVVHTRERRFGCEFCPARLVSRSAALYHRRRHTGEKPYACTECGAAFISSSRRTEHAKRKHNQGTRFQCTHCPAGYVRRKELEKHHAKAHKTT